MKKNNKHAEIETKVLGIFLTDARAMKRHGGKLIDYWWVEKEHKQIYDALCKSYRNNGKTDIAYSSNYMSNTNSALARMMTFSAESSEHIDKYVDILLHSGDDEIREQERKDMFEFTMDIASRVRNMHAIPVAFKKLHKDAVAPKYAKQGDAGMDLTAVSKSADEYGNVVYGTGLAFEIPVGYVGLVFPRSSNSKSTLSLTNCVGVIDSGYRGEIMLKYRPRLFKSSGKPDTLNVTYLHFEDMEYNVGDRVGQIIIMPYPNIRMYEVNELSSTERGAGGYGSSGK